MNIDFDAICNSLLSLLDKETRADGKLNKDTCKFAIYSAVAVVKLYHEQLMKQLSPDSAVL